MTREEILEKAQEEGGQIDLPDREAQRDGAWRAYLLGVALLAVVDLVNHLVLRRVDFGANFVLNAMMATLFVTKYRQLRKKHELIVAILWGFAAALMLVAWILQLVEVF
ncbi:MAG: hypothetical protein IJG45_00685 [Oscillospiraceae bacterium]|nr:hypothetical protein [Oscillospiraceae bacterium]